MLWAVPCDRVIRRRAALVAPCSLMEIAMKKVVFLLVGLCLVGGGLWWNAARQGSAGDLLVLYGNVDIRQVASGFRVGGRIIELKAEEGQVVTSGELLARLDPEPYEHARNRAQAELAMQRAEYAKMLAGNRPEDIAQARAALEGARGVYVNAVANLRRIEKLKTRQAIAQKDLDEARSAYTEAAARQKAAEEQLQLMEKGYREEDIARQEAAVQAAEAALDAAEMELSDTRLFAPQDGIVLTKVHEEGAIVQAGQTIYAITINNPVWIRAYVTQPDLGLIRPGQDVLLSVDARPDKTYRGTIGFISPVAEFTPKTVETKEVRNDLVFRFRVIADDPDNVMRQGMPVTITLRRDGSRP